MLKIRIENDTRCYGSDLILSAIYEINHYLNQVTANGIIRMSYDLEDRTTTFELSTGIHSVILLADVHNYNEPANRVSALWSPLEIHNFLCDINGEDKPSTTCCIDGEFVFDGHLLYELDGVTGNRIIITLINIEYDEKAKQLNYGIKITIRNVLK